MFTEDVDLDFLIIPSAWSTNAQQLASCCDSLMPYGNGFSKSLKRCLTEPIMSSRTGPYIQYPTSACHEYASNDKPFKREPRNR